MIVKSKEEPVRLNCKAEGQPEPTIEWYKDNIKILSTSLNPIPMKDSIMFLLVTKKNVGNYYCIAKNEVGKAKSRNASLEIACKSI